MAAIRSTADIARKWASVTPQRSADYEAGVRNPRTDWQRATIAAKDAWKDGVTRAAANDAFAKGVTAAGTSKWQDGAVTKGVTRWGPGVAGAEDLYAKGFAPYQAAIERVVLPPRFARRDPRNLLRVNAIVEALVKAKVAAGT